MFKIAYLAALAVFASNAALAAGDPAVGKAKTEAICASCHIKDDWQEESAASIQTKIQAVVAGKTKHKIPLKLTEEEIAGIAAYWGHK